MFVSIKNKFLKFYSKIREPFRQLARSEYKLIQLQRANEQTLARLDLLSARLESTSSDLKLDHLSNRLEDIASRSDLKLDHLSNRLENIASRLKDPTSLFQSLEQQILSYRNEVGRLRQMLAQNARSLRWIAEQMSRTPPPVPVPDTNLLVTVIMPTWNRGDIIERAIQSLMAQTYSHWECIIVDDGSTDHTQERLKSYLEDARFKYIYQSHKGEGITRNLAISQGKGEVIAYLDTDNVWFPNFLATIVSAFSADPLLQCAYTAQIIFNEASLFSYIRCEPFDYEALQNDTLRREGFIDLNVFAHLRSLFEKYGGFDERLDRFSDWDLILRYTKDEKTKCLPILGGVYNMGRADQISHINNYAYNLYLIQSKRSRPFKPPLKVLYILWHYPQLSESYVRTEILGVRKLGVEVEVWAEEKAQAAFESEVPVHYGRLQEAIDQVKPDLIHTHWLNMVERFEPELKKCSLPLTVRGHGFDFSIELAERLNQNPRVKSFYLFPHFADQCPSVNGKIKPLPVIFNADLYYPSQERDRRLVLRVGCALPSKDYRSFMETALLCPRHRFVLVLCKAHAFEFYADEFIELNKKLGNPVDLRINMQHEDVAHLIRQAGIYMHTVCLDGPHATPIGMPISIAEAMASGCYILGRRCSASAYYIQNAGKLYDTTEEAAALIRETEHWNDRQWQEAARCSIDRAYGNFVSVHVLETIVNGWRKIVGKN